MSIALPARAKLNLDLKVTGRRDDGLHELRTCMQAIDLHDLLEVEHAREARTTLRLSADMDFTIGVNAVTRAHAALEQAAGRQLPTHFRLHKRIPAGSGLGGASSDAAAALRALKVLHGLAVDLAPVAAQVGADVSFFLRGGSALVEGVGDRITPAPVDESWFAIAWPGVELSTPLVYKAWDEVRGDGANELRRAASRVNPSIDEFARSLGDGWQMTGSGSAFFYRCANRVEAEAAAARVECWTAVSRSVGAWA